MSKPDKSKEKYESEIKRHRRFKKLVRGPIMLWLENNSILSLDNIGAELTEGPAIIAVNHAAIYDFMFVTAAASDRDMAYVASEHLMRIKPWGQLIARYASIIPHKKGAKGSRTAARILERLSAGESVYLAVEGEQTWNGISLPIKPGNGKLAKKSGASLITYRIEGSYLMRPRWAPDMRYGKVDGKLVNVYTPEMLAEMSAEDIDEAISRDLYFDIWEWQRNAGSEPAEYSHSRYGFAAGLRRALCSCPKCSKIGNLTDELDMIKCDCGFEARFTETGFLDIRDGSIKDGPETIADWEKLDEERISELIKSAEHTDLELFGDEDGTLYSVDRDHNEFAFDDGRLSLESRSGRFFLKMGDEEFAVDDIYDMTMVQAGRLLFSVGKDYYEIRSGLTNLRKYMQAINIIARKKG